ncbi:MAG: hypothetical protein JNN07_16570 [Verrucomicrobiales bacterium]|nr:hypothetical protein [Verrucomicrobiales bacterium]
MSLLQALIQDPVRMNVYVALRTDGQAGDGTEAQPFDGSVLQNLSPPASVTVVRTSSLDPTIATTAVATTTVDHGYESGDIILLEGFSTSAAYQILGAFSITKTGAKTFTFRTFVPADATTAGTYSGGTCRKDPYRFDAVMRSLSTLGPIAVWLGPGTFETKGSEDCLGGVLAGGQPAASWRPWSGLKIRGSGMRVTTLKLVQAAFLNRPYYAIGRATMTLAFQPLIAFSAEDFTIDCNIAGQVNSQLSCAAIFIRGSQTRIRRIRVINFGRQGNPVPNTQECFVIGVGGSEYITSLTDGQRYNCVVEECVIEQPGLRSVRETTCLHLFSSRAALSRGGSPTVYNGFSAFNRSCVFRNNYVNCEYVENPVSIGSLVTPATGTQATVTTRTSHGLSAGNWFRLYGAFYNNGYDNDFVGSFQVDASPVPTATTFSYTPSGSIPRNTSPMAGSQMWLGRFPSMRVAVSQTTPFPSLTQITTTPNEWELTVATETAHFLLPGSTVVIEGTKPAAPTSGDNQTINAEWTVVANGNGLTRRGFKCRRIYATGKDPSLSGTLSDLTQGACGVVFQALAMSGATSSVIEGNQISHCQSAGPYNDTAATGSLVIRNNQFRWVRRGPNYNMGRNSNTELGAAPQVSASSLEALAGETFATFTVKHLDNTGGSPNPVAVPHGLVVGQPIAIIGATVGGVPSALFNIISTVRSVSLDNNSFTYALNTIPMFNVTADNPTPPTRPPEVISCNFTRDLLIENNAIELIPTGVSSSQRSIAIRCLATPTGPFNPPAPDPYVPDRFRAFGNVQIQNNLVRYVTSPDGSSLPGDVSQDKAVDLAYVINGNVENNVIDVANQLPMSHWRSNSVVYFNNRKSSGQLIQGALQDPAGSPFYPVQELSTLIEDAMALALL